MEQPKLLLLSFSEALWAEYHKRGIHIVALCPGSVETGFISKLGNESVRKTTVFSTTISPEEVAKYALKALRSMSSTYVIGIKNWLMTLSIRLAPRSLVARISATKLRSPSWNRSE